MLHYRMYRTLLSGVSNGGSLTRGSLGLKSKRWMSSEIRLKEYGADFSKSLELASINDLLSRKLNSDEVLVKLVAAPINPADINIIEGKYATLPDSLPAVIGNEGLFEVVAVSGSRNKLAVGDWVVPTKLKWGTWRTHAIETEQCFFKLPEPLNKQYTHAYSTLMINPCTAYRLLNDFVCLKENDTIIQNGANSAVGQAVIQLARIKKVNVVNIVRQRETPAETEKLNEMLKSLGAKYIFTEAELRGAELTKELWKNIPKPRLAFNCVGGKRTSDLVRLLDKQAVLVTYGGMSKQPLAFNTADFIFKDLKCSGFWLTAWRQRNPAEYKSTLAHMCSLVETKEFKAPKCKEFKLSDYINALKETQTTFTNSKILFVN